MDILYDGLQGEELQGKLFDLLVAAYCVEKSSCSFSRGVEMSVVLSSSNDNNTMIST